MLLDRVASPDRPPREVVLPTTLVIRASSGCAVPGPVRAGAPANDKGPAPSGDGTGPPDGGAGGYFRP